MQNIVCRESKQIEDYLSDFFCYATYEMYEKVNSKINLTPQQGCYKKNNRCETCANIDFTYVNAGIIIKKNFKTRKIFISEYKKIDNMEIPKIYM